MRKNNIILIGMPGCGKTTIGTEISEAIGYGYIDSDSVIVAREGKRLSEIIAEVGREAFLDIEERSIPSFARIAALSRRAAA